jgi:DNA-binding transcriptional LysR family regulator
MSITKASEEVFMSRQAVSKKILSLEERLGVKLFERTTSVIELTTEGKLYHDYFRNMVQDFEAFHETIVRTSTPLVHLLIGYELGVIVDKRIIEIIGEYKLQRDNMDFKIRRYDPQVIENKLLSGQLDMAFTTIPTHSKIYKDFSYITLEHAEYVLVTSKNHPKVNENTVLSNFNGAQAIYWNEDNSDDMICRKNFNTAWSGIGITLTPSIQCTSLSSAYTELLLGNAVHLCNAKNEMCTLPGIITYPLSKRELFGFVWNRNAPSEIKEFAEAIRKYEIT